MCVREKGETYRVDGVRPNILRGIFGSKRFYKVSNCCLCLAVKRHATGKERKKKKKKKKKKEVSNEQSYASYQHLPTRRQLLTQSSQSYPGIRLNAAEFTAAAIDEVPIDVIGMCERQHKSACK